MVHSRYFLILIFGFIGACTPKDRTPPEVTVPKTPKAKTPPWEKLFGPKIAMCVKPLEALKLGLAGDSVKALSPKLLNKSGWAIKGYGGAKVRALLHADTKRVRSIQVDFPENALHTLTKRWGAPKEGMVNGRNNAWFWFDDEAAVQAILVVYTNQSKLMFWPYVRLADLLHGPPSNDPKHLVSLLGRSSEEADRSYPRKMRRKLKPGFVAWLNPLQYWTRPLSLRIAEKNGRVHQASFKITTAGNPNLKTRFMELTNRGWGKPAAENRGATIWRKKGKELRLASEKAGRLRPPFPTLIITLTDGSEPAVPDPGP